MTTQTIWRPAASAAVLLALCACEKPVSPPPEAASSVSPAPAPQAASPEAARPAVRPPFSINEMMVMIVDQPGELLWDVEKGHEPKTSEDWYQLENHAVSLASAATVIQLGGTGPNDVVWAAQPEWRAASEHLINAALKSREAAKAKDLARVIQVNGDIVDACQACHDKYKPDIPTRGLFIHKRPGD